MKILITGSKGQLGKALVQLMEAEGQQCFAHDLDTLDIADFDRVQTAVKELLPELVINAAAYTDVDGAEKDWRTACRANAMAVRNLAVACAERDIPIVHVSTDFVFDGDADRPYRITDEPNPINVYGESKLMGERFLTSLHRKFYVVRTSWVFGDGNQNFLRKLFGWAAKNDVLKVVDDQTAAPTFAPDLAAAIWQLAQTGAYGLYHYHNAGACSRYEWARFALEQSEWTGRVEPVKSDLFPAPARRPVYSVLDLFPLDEMGIEIPTWQEATSRWVKEFSK
jgi:dTDP-4-dehydrorhamnose reductase